MPLYQRLLGHPFVYNHIRPFVVGGIDWAPLYRNLQAEANDVILDVGCGTGIAHQYLHGFAAYHGYDTDRVAIDFARRTIAGQNIHFANALVTVDDVVRIAPTRIILGGLLHHLSDGEAISVLQMCGRSPTLKRIATSDVVYLRGRHVSNVLAYFDRGKFVRTRDQYLALIRRAGLTIETEEVVRSHPRNGKAWYFMTGLVPGASPGASGAT